MRDGQIISEVRNHMLYVLRVNQKQTNTLDLRMKVLEGIITSRKKLLKFIWLNLFLPHLLNKWLDKELSIYIQTMKVMEEARADKERVKKEMEKKNGN